MQTNDARVYGCESRKKKWKMKELRIHKIDKQFNIDCQGMPVKESAVKLVD